MAYMTKEWRGRETFLTDAFHHVEFYVGNAKQAAYFYQNTFGFESIAYRGPETGYKDSVSYVLKLQDIYFVLTSPLTSSHPASEWLKKHGDSVADIALRCPDPEGSHQQALILGAANAYFPQVLQDTNGIIHKCGIRTYGDVIHSLTDSRKYNGIWEPGYIECKNKSKRELPINLVTIDHIVGNVNKGEMNQWSEFYQTVFGYMAFVEFDENDISTQYSALKSRVVRSKNWRIKIPLNEPAHGRKKSQIEEFLDYHEGPGVQHIALLTGDIIQAVERLRNNGVDFLPVPNEYYKDLRSRVGDIGEDLDLIQKNGILVDRDQEGYLLQLFTKPILDRPTLFFEIIQRHGALGFGQGNFQALFESIEREQERRGNL